MKVKVQMRYANPSILMDVIFGRASLRWAKRNGTIQTAAEVGVQAGINAKSMLRVIKPVRMVCADPYEGYSTELGMFYDQIERIAHRRLKRFKQVEWVKSGDQQVIADAIGRETMDYLYIDAAHDCASVSKDMRAYWPCVKKGGVLAGHDIVWPSVFRAIANFQYEYNVDIYCSGTDWWIKK